MTARALAVDLGSRRIGVAVSDGAGTMAFPRPFIERSGDPEADRRSVAEAGVSPGGPATVEVKVLPSYTVAEVAQAVGVVLGRTGDHFAATVRSGAIRLSGRTKRLG